MEFSMSRSWIRLSVVCLACGTLLLAAHAADPAKPSAQSQPSEPTPVDGSNEPTPAEEPVEPQTAIPEGLQIVPESEQAEDKGPWEVTDQVELIYREKFELKGDKTVAAKVLLKNKSENDIAGKLVLVVDGASVPGLTLAESQGQFTEQTPYLQMVPAKRTLEAAEQTPVKTVILQSQESLKEIKPSEIALRWRAFTLTKPADLSNEPPADDVKVPGKAYTWGDMRKVMRVQDRVTPELVSKHGGAVVGAGTSENENGQLVIQVFAARGGMSRKLPGEIDGIPVEVTVSGELKAGPGMSRVIMDENGKAYIPELSNDAETTSLATGPIKPNAAGQVGPPTRRFTRPVPIGVSSINQTDICASGTLGCRCRDRAGNQYVLSNCHVYGESNGGTIGDPLVQPSQGDIVCLIVPTDVIATLHDFQRFRFFTGAANFPTAPVNIIDAAVGLSPIGQVDVATPLVGYGVPQRTPQESPYVGMAVQKCGRTTGFTKGKIRTLNAEAVINFGGGQLARFRSCINVGTATRLPAFGGPGDSGSLVVTDPDRRPVGLLFAGGGINTFLCPISPILHRFKVGVDDGTGAAPVLGSGRMGNASGPVKQHQNETPLTN